MKKTLKRTSPEQHGISSQRTEKLLRELHSLGNEVHGFLLSVDGDVICESFTEPYAPNIPHSCHSLGKSYTATAVGLAVTQGLVSVEDHIVDISGMRSGNWGSRSSPEWKRFGCAIC